MNHHLLRASPLALLLSLSLPACSVRPPSATHQDGNLTAPMSAAAKTPPPVLSKATAPTLATVKPPLQPKINHHYISDADLAKLPLPQQPQALTDQLMGLAQGTIEERQAKLKAKVLADMVYVEGGSFMRGDFASLMGVEGVTRMTYNDDDKVVREITLSDFWISKYKTTYAEFDVFTDATGKPRNGMEFGAKLRHPLIPAGAYWQQAKDYCQWLGQLTGLPLDLPTEAQWEYAARSRGQFFMIGTDDGNIQYGRNLHYAAQERLFEKIYGGPGWSYPVGMLPPNPIGLFDISSNGQEWVEDWYAEDAYRTAELRDPKGPLSGGKKVVRGWGSDDIVIGVNVWRHSDYPIPLGKGLGKEGGAIKPKAVAFIPKIRCSVKSN